MAGNKDKKYQLIAAIEVRFVQNLVTKFVREGIVGKCFIGDFLLIFL